MNDTPSRSLARKMLPAIPLFLASLLATPVRGADAPQDQTPASRPTVRTPTPEPSPTSPRQLPGEQQMLEMTDDLLLRLTTSRRAANYQRPSAQYLSRLELLFQQTLDPEASFTNLQRQWQAMGFQLQQYQLGDVTFWLVEEPPSLSDGGGRYVFRRGDSVPLVWQAPHAFFDKHTGEICARLFLDSSSLAAAWNTAHRSLADLAHEPQSRLNAFTKAVVTARPATVVVQLHGFGVANRDSRPTAAADLIVSNGSAYPEAFTRQVVTRWRITMPDTHTRLFPYEVSELGGTTNQQAELMRELNRGTFLHVEVGEQFRQTLRTTSDRRRCFAQGIIEAQQDHGGQDVKPR